MYIFKKNYAYKLLVKKGKVFTKPKIDYTGIQIVKSDAAKFTQDLLRTMIEDVILGEVSAPSYLKTIITIVDEYHKKFNKLCDEFEFSDIGFPGKWQKKTFIINGMQIYNFITNKKVFSFGSSGKFIYCSFKNPNLFTNIDMSKINGICIPYVYDKELIKNIFKKYQIEIDRPTQWAKLFTTTCERIINLVKFVNQQTKNQG